VEDITKQIAAAGGRAHPAVLDALDDAAVNEYIDCIVNEIGSIDIVFNAVGPLATEYGNGKYATDLKIEEFMVPLETVVKSQFITARGHVEGTTAIGTAFGAIESLSENLAVEVGPAGVRVVCLRITANTDSRTIQQTMDALASKMNVTKNQMISRIASLNFLKVPTVISDTAKAAVFLASDRARMLTGTVVNSTAGAALD